MKYNQRANQPGGEVGACDYTKPFCYECHHFCISLGTSDYSEVTPGEAPEISCAKGHYYIDGPDDDYKLNTWTFRGLIRKARECNDFEVDERVDQYEI